MVFDAATESPKKLVFNAFEDEIFTDFPGETGTMLPPVRQW